MVELWVVTCSGDFLYGIFKDELTALEHFNCDKDADEFAYFEGEYIGYPFGSTYFRPHVN